MANLIRSPKSGSDWTQHDLEAFRITVHNADAATFFNNPDLPPPSVPEAILDDPSPNNNAEHRRFFPILGSSYARGGIRSRRLFHRPTPLIELRRGQYHDSAEKGDVFYHGGRKLMQRRSDYCRR
ncbi:hypothetical protein HGRIS_008851 [Hohenbuehelia grisea]|uniref:Uncharacterized protein n=1 Tax=Hohenbuehelia grisea TaxID=104357 RepID=A0ABR3IZD4_9AGAR